MEEKSLYDRVGDRNLKCLVDNFYEAVFKNPILSPLFQKTPKEVIKEKQILFLTQFLGGPALYSERFGHPRMRARHMPHTITEEGATEWLRCMAEAVNSLPIEDSIKDELFMRFPQTAYFMVNTANS